MDARDGGTTTPSVVVVESESLNPESQRRLKVPWARRSLASSRRPAIVVVGQIGVVAGLLGLWEIATRQGYLNAFFVSKPSSVYTAGLEVVTDPVFLTNLESTVVATMVGFAAGALTGVALGLLLARLPLLGTLFDPVLTGLNSMPRVALAPLFILWFGIGLMGKSLLAASLVVFIVLATTRSGVKNADADILTMSRLMGATKNQTFRKVIVPISIPSIFAGLRLGAVYALLGVVVSEMVAARTGLGVLLTRYSNSFDVSSTFAILLILAVIATVLNKLVDLVEGYLLRWHGDEVLVR